MNFRILLTLTLFGLWAMNSSVSAQCSAGEVELSVEIHTDLYGYEGYWEIVAAADNCGTNTLLSGGNSAVGCAGGGVKAQPSGGYGNNLVITSSTICVTDGSLLKLEYRDDWGDGGFEFFIMVNGYVIEKLEGQGATQTLSFTAKEPLQYNAALTDIDQPYGYIQTGPNDLEMHLFNLGSDTITSVGVSYQIDNDPPVSATVSGLNITNYEEGHITHSTPWNPSANGTYNVKVWIDQINGNADMDNANDTLSKQVEVGPGIPNIIDSYLTTPTKADVIGRSIHMVNTPTDLDFHPNLSRKELWVINKRTEASGGSTVTFSNAGTPTQTSVHKVDGNSWHFMSLPTGIAFSENTNFANSPGVFDANHNGGQPFTGPALWSSDPAIYAQPSGGNGSHLDMLHESPMCQGIAHEKDNVFWVFDGYNNDIVRYDFADDHGPGNDDHSDGVIWRYSQEPVAKDAGNKVVSHLVYDKATDWLYVVDNENKRVIRIDAKSGTKGGTPTFGPFETLAEYVNIVNYTWETVVDSGLIEPAGIDVIGDRMIVSDYSTSEIIFYDISSMPAVEMKRISTGAQGIMGIKIGPEGKIWYVDFDDNHVYKLEFSAIGLDEYAASNLHLYPNPSNGMFRIQGIGDNTVDMEVYDAGGKLVAQLNDIKGYEAVELNLGDGFYMVKVIDPATGTYETKRLLIKQ